MFRLSALLLAASLHGQTGRVDFNRDIRPILSDNCFACHGPDEKQRAMSLRLDTHEGAMERKGVIVPGDAAKSRLVMRVASPNPANRMPPAATGKTLTPAQVDLIRRWIAEGAKWQQHWSYSAPQRPELPAVKDKAWVRNPIDDFVLARLERENLKPSPEAGKITLLRRVHLDLTGLPPSPDDVREFVADKSPDAYEKRVDKLLATSHHAERLAMQWLDLARYADTHGYHIDSHRDMWPWRDWVIRAYQKNMPFDQFTIEQLAGDLLPNSTREQKVATGFNRNHMINYEGGAIPEEYLTEYVVDRVEATSTVWMGMTMGCARCHDHKYDPIKQKDFYRLFAFFNTVEEKGLDGREGNAKPFLQLSTAEQKTRRDRLMADIEQHEEALSDKKIDPVQAEWEKSAKLPDPPREGLLAHWELDGSLADSSGRYNRAHLKTGTASYGNGFVGRAAELDGESIIDFGPADQIDLKKPFTFAFWVRTGGNTPMTFLHRRGLDIAFGDMIPAPGLKRTSHVHFRLGDVHLRSVERVLRADWLHFAFTNGGAGDLKFYVNGKPSALEPLTEPAPAYMNSGGNLEAGNKLFGKALKGSLDDVRLYSRPISASEAEILGLHWPYKFLVSYSESKRTKDERQRLREYFLTYHAPESLKQTFEELNSFKRQLNDLDQSIPTTMVMAEMEKPRDTYILGRGDYRNKTEKVTPGVPSVLPPLPPDAPANRLGFAKWLVDPSHPLTARVAVNRYWQMYFGLALVKTTEDFGSQGEPPSHPQLLDWLATEFVRTGWDVRAMQRLIVTSATYRQSSKVTPELLERDPENRLLARGARFRLPAETVRDNALAASGLLNEKVGGPSVFPYQPPGLWEDIAYGDVYSAQTYTPSSGADLYRRSMYTFWKRTAPPASYATFDAPDREKCVARRSVTNTPLQALVLLNDPTYLEAARTLAAEAIRDAKPSRRTGYLFRRLLGRSPSSRESQILNVLVRNQLTAYQRDKAAAEALLSVGERRPDDKLNKSELAAWTMAASTILNMDETITRE